LLSCCNIIHSRLIAEIAVRELSKACSFIFVCKEVNINLATDGRAGPIALPISTQRNFLRDGSWEKV
jgi:hypothetical protein